MRRANVRRPPDNMDSMKLQFRAKPNNLFSRNPKPTSTTKLNLLIFTSIAVALAFCFYLFHATKGSRNSSNTKMKYGIFIDGGSTGTRIHVLGLKDGAPYFGKELASMRVNPGLSAYAEDPDEAGRSLVDLLEFGRVRVPRDCWEDTEIRLMATAGLRRLELEVQERILESCRKVLRLSGFKFRNDWASVITGSDEGLYAWVIANYALGTLGGDPQQTTGIIELGGASAQVTFVSNEPIPPEFSRTVKFGNFTYHLYSHSMLHFGQNVAFESLREALESKDLSFATGSLQKGISIDPCTPKGFSLDLESHTLSPHSLSGKNKYTFHAKGNFSECRSAALRLLHKEKDKCTYPHCHIGSTFIPKLHGKFLATENFFYTAKFFGLGPKRFLADLMMAGEQFCEEDWSRLKRKYNSLDEEDLLRYCFSSAYIVALLHDSLGIALDDERVSFTNHVGGIPLDWALGAFIMHSVAELSTDRHHAWIATMVSDDSPTLISLFAICLIVMFTAWSVSKWRKPQLKTIYDLEKGRYIVTRVNRC